MYLLNANHCPGSVMMLFSGYMGVILHTGDMRYSAALFRDSLYRQFRVDQLILDDTFLDPIYHFFSQPQALEQLIGIITGLERHRRVYMMMDNLGREDILLALARHFQTKIVVSE